MSRRENKLYTIISATICLANLLGYPRLLKGKANTGFSLAHQSTPELNVRVYSFAGLSSWVLRGAEIEAARMLHSVHIELKWIDCTSPVVHASCMSIQLPTDLIVRFLPKALSQVSTSALGIAGSSGDYGTAFIFYDRVAALRTHTRFLPPMIGRVMAHEITHLLLPQQGHSDLGLMRAQWSADDLEPLSSACLGLPSRSVQLIEKEALKRVLAARPR
ncbi:MAG: hypothetical protein WAM39_09900 [Bryobacteraceae bacterium]